MADIPLTNIAGASGAPTTVTLGTLTQVNSGASGTIITIPAVAGQRPVLTNLYVYGTAQETGITINVGGNAIISGGTLDDYNADRVAGTFLVGVRTGAGDEPEVYGNAGDSITVVKDSGSTANSIRYSYRYVK